MGNRTFDIFDTTETRDASPTINIKWLGSLEAMDVHIRWGAKEIHRAFQPNDIQFTNFRWSIRPRNSRGGMSPFFARLPGYEFPKKNTSASNIKDHQNLPIAISHPDFFYILTSLHTALGSASTRVSGPDSSSSLPPQESWPWAWTWMDAPASFAATSGLSRSVETAGGL